MPLRTPEELAASEESTRRLQQACDEASRRFGEMSEEEQALALLAQKISYVLGMASSSITKDEVARIVLERDHGPKFTNRVLADPDIRNKLGLSHLGPE